MKYVSHTRIPMRGNAELSEKWLQERLVEDPGLLGFGEVMVKDVERTQSHGGRLDMLLADPEKAVYNGQKWL